MPKNRTGRSREAREKKRKEEEEEIEELNSQIEALSETVDHFAELPLTQPTKHVLNNLRFNILSTSTPMRSLLIDDRNRS
jgi:hypothetical protein